jgi:hypothetical protein
MPTDLAPRAAWHPPNSVGDSDPKIVLAKQKLSKYSYGRPANDGTPIYTEAFGAALTEYQHRRNEEIDKGLKPGPRLTRPGWFDFDTKVQLEIEPRPGGGANPPPPHLVTDEHYLSAPGSGVDWWIGPPFTVGEWLKNENGVHHWPLGYPKGGYMGFMGGDSAQSYLDTIALEGLELERRIRDDILGGYGIKLGIGQKVTAEMVAKLPAGFKLALGGYSQSAEGIIRAADRLFSDGGVFELLRPFLKVILVFGDPVRSGGGTRYGRTPPGAGISNYRPPAWLLALIAEVVAESGSPDFYACCTSKIAKLAYQVIVRAETELPFLIYLAQIAIPALLNLLSGGLLGGAGGGLLGGLGGLIGHAGAIPLLSSVTGLSGGALTPLMGAAQEPTDDVSAQIAQLLTPTGLLTSIPDLIGLLIAMPGIQSHGEYHLVKPEWGNLTGEQTGVVLVRQALGI